MKRGVVAPAVVILAALAAAGFAGTSARASRPRPRVSLSPSSGSPTTTFRVSFTAPAATGHHGASERRYVLSASVAHATAGCVASVEEPLPYGRRHARVRVTLDPAHLGGRWCTGTLRGRVQELQHPVCSPHTPCPEFVRLLATVGTFSFSVRPARGHSRPPAPGTTTGTTTTAPTTTPTPSPPPPAATDRTPPTFAGITSAFACTPGAQRPGQTTPFTLTWTAATDNETPSSEILYEVFVATTPGGEDLGSPNWTTPAGVTTYTTPGLPSHGTFYFTVRARDLAGNEDHNTVEVRGVDPCL